MPKQVILLASNDTDRTITVIVDGVKYEYWMGDHYVKALKQVRVLQAARAYGRLITLLKTRSERYDKLATAS